jgi:hypothetical protein
MEGWLTTIDGFFIMLEQYMQRKKDEFAGRDKGLFLPFPLTF